MFALVDCNNFFVSCERVFRPELEGRPVVVLSNNDGCVVSRSNESKAMGIKMGTPLFQLKTLVDNGRLEVCSSNYTLYGDLSSRVMSILSDAVPKIEIYSIDEAFLHLDGFSQAQSVQLCRELVRKIRKWVGIPVSIGVAPTKTLAKIASHFAKRYPGYKGVCIIDNEQKRCKALSLTPIGDVWGIGRRLAPKMLEHGIRSAADFAQRPQEWVGRVFHINGERTWLELNGTVAVDEETGEARQSICTSRSFAEMVEEEVTLEGIVSDFAAVCSGKLRKEGTAACDVTTFLYTNRFRDDLDQYFPSATIHLSTPASSVQEIVASALKALRLIWKPGYKYKKAGVVVSRIVPADAVQGTLFDSDPLLKERQDRLSRIIDSTGGAKGPVLRLASQRDGHYTEGIRSEHRSQRFSTSWNEIMKVK